MRSILIVFSILLFAISAQAQEKEYALLIFGLEADGVTPTADSNALHTKIDSVEDWLLSGDFVEIINPRKGLKVTKAGQFGLAVWFLMDRILKPTPTDWFETKVTQLRLTYDFRGYATDNAAQELIDRSYTVVAAGE